MVRLLVLSCSEAKAGGPEPLPAIDRYDGPPFRVVRKFLREVPTGSQDVEIFVLSAKHGLIPASTRIQPYDQRMTRERAAELHQVTLEKVQEIVAQCNPTQIFFSLGRDYLRAIEGYEDLLPSSTQVLISDGPAGKKLTALKAWLYGSDPASVPSRPKAAVRQPELPLDAERSVQIRGRSISLSTEQALDLARRALVEGWGDSDSYRMWYALVDDHRVSPKWWVSLLSDLSVSSFAADEARRVLRALGIEVYRTDN